MSFAQFLQSDNNVNQGMRNLGITQQRKIPTNRPTQKYIQQNEPLNQNNYTATPNQKSEVYKVIEKNANVGVPKLERVSTSLSATCVNIDSRDRNRDQFPNSNNFQVHVNPSNTFVGAGLYTQFKNIYSIRLISAVVPDFTADHAYLTLVIPELQDTMVGTNDTLKKSFALLFPDTVHGNFVSSKTKDMCYCYKKFSPPLASINRLTLEFYDPSGTLVNFGTDNTLPTAPNANVQSMIVLEITSVDSNTSVIESRAIW